MTPYSFLVLHDRALSSPVALAAWCPTMDLLATVSLDNQLTVRRLDWQTLWVACPNAAITALCWKPDGKCAGMRNPSETGGLPCAVQPIPTCKEWPLCTTLMLMITTASQ